MMTDSREHQAARHIMDLAAQYRSTPPPPSGGPGTSTSMRVVSFEQDVINRLDEIIRLLRE